MSERKFDGVHASYFLGIQQCRNCKETIYAAIGATRVSSGVLFKWRCDLCDELSPNLGDERGQTNPSSGF